MKTCPDDPINFHLVYDVITGRPCGHVEGLTKREYFAAMALQGILASGSKQSIEQDAELALESADALINALNKQ